MKTKKLIHNNKIILNNMKYATSTWAISKGLMFKDKKKVDEGMCLVMPASKDVKFGATVTMFFCFVDMQIIFVNSKFEVVDKIILKTWNPSYTPKAECKYVIESIVGKFDNIKIGDKVEIK